MSLYQCLKIYLSLHILPKNNFLLTEARWCVVSDQEAAKCNALLNAINSLINSYRQLPELKCVRGNDRFACMDMIDADNADLMSLDPGMGYTAGDYFTMMPLMAEMYAPLGKFCKVYKIWIKLIYF